MASRTWAVAVLAIVLLLAPTAGVVRPSTAVGPPATSTPPTEFVTDELSVPEKLVTSALDPGTPISLTFALRPSNEGALSAFLDAQQDPRSTEYRSFLSSAEFDRQYSPTPDDVAGVERALEVAGGTDLVVTPDRLGVGAVFTVEAAQTLLGVRLVGLHGADARLGYTAVGVPRLPPDLEGLVEGIGGLSDAGSAGLAGTPGAAAAVPRGPTVRPSLFVRSGPGSGVDWNLGSDYAQAYNATELWPGALSVPNATFPNSTAIATLLASGYNAATSTVLPPWDPLVVGQYFHDTLGPGWPVPNVTGVPVNVSGVALPPAPGSFHGVNDSTLDEYENSLDLEMAGSVAPGAPLFNFYFSGAVFADPATPIGDVADDLADDLGAALAYNYSPNHLAVVSGSFGLPDLNDSLWDLELEHAQATGVTVLSASGDQADAPEVFTHRGVGPGPLWPATAAFNDTGTLSIGGASVTVSGTPTSTYNGSPLNATFDDTVNGIANTTAWYDTSRGPGSYVGTEGGTSEVFPEPWWQFDSAAQPAIVNATILEGSPSLGRAGPDLGFPAGPTIAYVYANGTGTIYYEVLEGTSVAAPVCAGLLADVVAVLSNRSGTFSPLGFLDPELYRIASFYANLSLSGPPPASDPFLAVTQGSNFLFSATPGWDPLTGWGGLDGPRFLAALENATIANYRYIGPTPVLPPSNPTAQTPWAYAYLVVGLGAAGAIAVVVVALATSRRPTPPRVPAGAVGVPPGAYGPPGVAAVYSGPTFSCPFCGTLRPAEPVRCPGCGAL